MTNEELKARRMALAHLLIDQVNSAEPITGEVQACAERFTKEMSAYVASGYSPEMATCLVLNDKLEQVLDFYRNAN